MPRIFSSYPIDDPATLRQKLLGWADGYEICALLDSCDYQLPHHRYAFIAGIGATEILPPGRASYDSISDFQSAHDDWIFGHVGFEATQQSDNKTNRSGFPSHFFFVPEIVVEIRPGQILIGVLAGSPDDIYSQILNTRIVDRLRCKADFEAAVSKEDFVSTIGALQRHIRRGDCYEINFCQEFYAEAVDVSPPDLYNQLIQFSPNPFSAFYKYQDQYALCASPERYVQKSGNQLVSQPIKGTAARSQTDPVQDAKNRRELQHSEKDRRENVIVVDLVRNDLSRVCEPGTVAVEELFGIYDFPTVFQMVSTVTGRLSADKNLAKVLEASFPMGSMTGAPKKKVLELIDQYEPGKRGIYSGTIGYINPEKDFDFNVVIRTLLYNRQTGYLGYFAGAGITDMSDAEEEYEECLLKAAVLDQLFEKSY